VLLAAIIALFAGVALVPLVRGRRLALAAMDGFVLTALAGLLLVHVIPESIHEAGFWAVIMVVIGVFLPRLLEGGTHDHNTKHKEPWSILTVASLGLLVHAFLDGGALATEALHIRSTDALTLSVVLHRLPMGLIIGLLGSKGRRWLPWAVATAVAVATVGGYQAGLGALPAMGITGLALMQALVAGTLGHVVLERAPDLSDNTQWGRWASALGALAGIGLSVGLLFVHGHSGGPTLAMQAAVSLIDLLLESAPALLIAFAGAGLLTATLRGEPLKWIGRGSSPVQALKGMVVGLPVPVCSCGVLPVYQTLIARGVPASAALAFLVATPELGIDALLISIPLLGGSLTLARLLAAGVVAWLTGILVGAWLPDKHSHGQAKPEDDRPLGVRLRTGMVWSVTELADHLLPWMAVGLAVAAIASPLLATDALTGLPQWAQVPAAVLIGLPVYVCASGSTPIAAVLLHKGLSPGAALAFLLAGPATNATTFGVLRGEFGTRAAILFGVVVGGGAMLAGFAVDAIFVRFTLDVATAADTHEHGWISWAALGGLTLLALSSLFRQGPRGWLGQLWGDGHSHDHGDHSDHAHGDHAHGDHAHDHDHVHDH
jgi:uncharacterized membrane protein YraQ (UPF0718 family)